MPIYLFVAVVILALTPPLTGVAIFLLTGFPPRLRSTLALGTTFLLAAFAFAMLGVASAALDGRQPFVPYMVVTGIPALTVARMMQLEIQSAFHIPNSAWDIFLDM
jgi:hypothetical protein